MIRLADPEVTINKNRRQKCLCRGRKWKHDVRCVLILLLKWQYCSISSRYKWNDVTRTVCNTTIARCVLLLQTPVVLLFSLGAVHVSLLCNFSWGSDGDFFPLMFFVQFQICNRSIVTYTQGHHTHTGWKVKNFSSPVVD